MFSEIDMGGPKDEAYYFWTLQGTPPTQGEEPKLTLRGPSILIDFDETNGVGKSLQRGTNQDRTLGGCDVSQGQGVCPNVKTT